MDMRSAIFDIVKSIHSFDKKEVDNIQYVLDWIDSGADLFRIQKPSIPKQHLVSYVLPIDMISGRVCLFEHKKSGLLLPAGGHVDVDEDPFETAVREAQEELGLNARGNISARPFFLSVSETAGANIHTDVSLWYILSGEYDVTGGEDYENEFSAHHWYSFSEVLEMDIKEVDPHMHRVIWKLQGKL